MVYSRGIQLGILGAVTVATRQAIYTLAGCANLFNHPLDEKEVRA